MVGSLKSQGKTLTTSEGGLSPKWWSGESRPDITAWGALVWTYADQIAHAASSDGNSRHLLPRLAESRLGSDHIGAGVIAGFYEPAPDARLIDEKLKAWFQHDGLGLACVIRHAEQRRNIPAVIVVPRVRAVPVYDRNGEVLIERRRLPNRGRVVSEYCMVEFEGTSHDVANAEEASYRAFYGMFLAFLDVMPGFQLARWKITGRGLTTVDESLT